MFSGTFWFPSLNWNPPAGPVSSLTISPSACPSPSAIVALVGLERLTKNSSSGSSVVSLLTVTLTSRWVTPGAKVTVPAVAT